MMAAPVSAVGSNKYGMDAEFFTRGQIGDADNRGGSMVQKHLEKLQVEKENQALGKLSVMMPQFGAAVRVVSLQESNWDVDNAAHMLDRFSNDYADELKGIEKKRKRIGELAEEAAAQSAKDAKEAEKASSSENGSDSGSDSDSDRGKKRSKGSKGSKNKSKKGKDRSKGKKSKKEKKDRDRKRKSSSGKDKKPAVAAAGAENFGRFGIIKEADATNKHSEFMLWALEVKKLNIEKVSKPDEKELYKDFMEDYNTGTMPHRKYYNLEVYQKEKAAKAVLRGGPVVAKKKSALDDEEDMRRRRAEELVAHKEARLMEAYQELKYSGKAKDMREQELLRLQMQQAYKTGDKELAAKLQKRLEPEVETFKKLPTK